MIAVRLEGRLGNQLFQYAFIHTAAAKLGCSFYLDKSIDVFLPEKYFKLKPDLCHIPDRFIFSIKGYKNLFSFHARNRFYNWLKKAFKLKPIIFDSAVSPETQIPLISDGAIYYGFFQSEDYFKYHSDQIKDLFTVKNIYSDAFKDLAASLGLAAGYVAVHIRRGDYSNYGWTLSYDYFRKAIASVHTDKNFYVFISDEPEAVEAEFQDIGNKYVSDNEEIIDLQFLLNADICILSNSSFSWWGAYLNKKNAKILAPEYWLGQNEQQELPVSVIPSGFTKFHF